MQLVESGMYVALSITELITRPSESWLDIAYQLELNLEFLERANLFFCCSTFPLLASYFAIKYVYNVDSLI